MVRLETILAGINSKDEKSWRQFYNTCYAALCSYAETMIRDADGAKDMVQEVLVNIWISDLTFSTSKELLGYLYKAIYHRSLTSLRNRRKHEKILNGLIPEEGSGEEQEQFLYSMVQEEITRLLYVHIQSLPFMRRQVIELSMCGLSGREIAEKLGISLNTVKVQKSKSLKYLREKLLDTRMECCF